MVNLDEGLLLSDVCDSLATVVGGRRYGQAKRRRYCKSMG